LWRWREFRPEILGKRHKVAVPSSGFFGTLVENDGDLKLVVEGEVFHPNDDLGGSPLNVLCLRRPLILHSRPQICTGIQ
jgi:hypothetical protein